MTVGGRMHAPDLSVRNNSKTVGVDFSLQLGHATALTTHRVVIHYRVVASLPRRSIFHKSTPPINRGYAAPPPKTVILSGAKNLCCAATIKTPNGALHLNACGEDSSHCFSVVPMYSHLLRMTDVCASNFDLSGT